MDWWLKNVFMAVSFQCMTKFTTNKKNKLKKKMSSWKLLSDNIKTHVQEH